MNAPEYDQAKADVWEEVRNFYNVDGVYNGHDTAADTIALFLERNHIVRIPKQAELVVTEDGVNHNGYPNLSINGKIFGSNPDVFYWQKSVEDGVRLVEARQEQLRYAVEDLEKRRAILKFLTDKQAKETQYEAEREARRRAILATLCEGTLLSTTHVSIIKAADQILDLQDALDTLTKAQS